MQSNMELSDPLELNPATSAFAVSFTNLQALQSQTRQLPILKDQNLFVQWRREVRELLASHQLEPWFHEENAPIVKRTYRTFTWVGDGDDMVEKPVIHKYKPQDMAAWRRIDLALVAMVLRSIAPQVKEQFQSHQLAEMSLPAL
jgi:hypothetical protein